ncbi:WD_domain_-_G-beta_repeat_-_putative [Leishmania major strain Friedlin]|nr:WD_domain_-_G-beta_repeat_-_putative [Leishmania major strain Friedlin]
MSSSSGDEYDPAEVTVHTTVASPSLSDTVVPSAAPFLRSAAGNASAATVAAAPALASLPKTAASVLPSSSSPTPPNTGNDVDGGYRLHSNIKGRIRCLTLNTAGTTLCAGSEDGQLCMWDFTVPLKSYRVQPTRVLTPFVNRISGLQPIIALTCASDDSYFVACQDGDSPVLVRASGEQLGYCAIGERGLMDVIQCKGHRAPVTCVAAHTHDAAAFFTGSQDGTVRLWNTATFKQRSVYAVKHGSGQLTDTHAVESVASLDSFHNGLGRVFASGGQDGRVQIWDSRVKYRPGGAIATVDMYAAAAPAGPDKVTEDPFMEKHVGGMMELHQKDAGASNASGSYGLAVRLGSAVKIIDLRQLSHSDGTTAPKAVLQEAATGLPHVLDTSALSIGRGGGSSTMMTCTSRVGYRHTKGGHVVQYRYADGDRLVPTLVWRAGKQDEDVLCACADISRADGCVFAGLSSGDVVVHGAFSSGAAAPQPMEAWLQTRPQREGYERAVGVKAPRAVEDDADLLRDLF